MTDPFFDPARQASPDRGPSAGALLRQAREAAGLHVAALAVSIRVPVKRLEALEADRLDELPDAVFARALAASVCRALKIDPAPILAKLPQVNPRVLNDQGGLNTPFREGRGAGSAWTALGDIPRGVLWAAGGLLIGAALLAFQPWWSAWLPAMPDRSSSTPTGEPVPRGTDAVPAPAATRGLIVEPVASAAQSAQPVVTEAPRGLPAASEPAQAVASAAAAVSSAAVAARQVASALVGAASQVIRPAASASGPAGPVPAVVASAALKSAPTLATASSPARGGSAPALAAGPDWLVVKAVADTWVSISEPGGVSIARRVLARGETLSAGGKGPLFVIIGRVDAAQVVVRGKPFDLATVAKDNVARFEAR